MLFNIEFWYREKYLPTKRHRNLRERFVKSCADVEVKEVTENEFPVAFIVHDYKSIYEKAKSYDDFNGNSEYKMFSEEIRTYDGKLYMPVRIAYGSSISLCFEPLEYIKKQIEDYAPYWKGGEEFTEESIIKENNIAECQKIIFDRAEDYIIYDGKVWKTCGEPMYVIQTFGLGCNHGGTGFFIMYLYNENICNNNYFNALEREKAISYGKQVALNRGDTESIDGMGVHDIIEVLIPEMVTRNPQKDHGKGFDISVAEDLMGKELEDICMITSEILERNQKKITGLWNGIISMLPPQPRSYDTADDPGFWTNGEEILCPSEAEMNMVYEFLNDIFNEFGNYTLVTGWYDPEEDVESGEQDDCTGFNYIRLE